MSLWWLFRGCTSSFRFPYILLPAWVQQLGPAGLAPYGGFPPFKGKPCSKQWVMTIQYFQKKTCVYSMSGGVQQAEFQGQTASTKSRQTVHQKEQKASHRLLTEVTCSPSHHTHHPTPISLSPTAFYSYTPSFLSTIVCAQGMQRVARSLFFLPLLQK